MADATPVNLDVAPAAAPDAAAAPAPVAPIAAPDAPVADLGVDVAAPEANPNVTNVSYIGVGMGIIQH